MSEDKICISNKVCRQINNSLEKVTIIRFKEKEVIIKDEYRFCRNSEQPAKSQTILPIPKKKLIKSNKKTLRSHENQRLTKNLPKNYIKAFVSFLEGIKT